MNNNYFLCSWMIFLGYWFLIAYFTIKILIKKKTRYSSITWLILIYKVPFLGMIIWLFFDEPYLSKKKTKLIHQIWKKNNQWLQTIQPKNCIVNKKNKLDHPLLQLCYKKKKILGVSSDHLQLLTNSKDTIRQLIQDIHLAKNNIEMVFYIWRPGGLADEVAKALILSAKRGITCRLMLDSAGSIEFFKSKWVHIMRQAGVNIVESLKIHFFKNLFNRVDLRQHRKIILIDNYITYTGSMNLIDPNLFKTSHGIGKWIDLMTRIEGPVATAIGIIYSSDWEFETGKKILPSMPTKNNSYSKKNNFTTSIHIIASGPGFSEHVIHQSFLIAIYSAKKQLIITTPYLVPSSDVLYAICTAAQRGVKVIIIIPKYNDSILVQWASRAFFSELLESGVKIYQFKRGLLHSKSILIDNQISLIGTANLDMRSLWLNFEITLVIDDQQIANTLESIQHEYIRNSKQVNAKLWFSRSYWKRILEKIIYFFSPLL
ncbi:MAG: cardiolipin synthase [Buchnera aphidicola (Eriosoma harunire)]